MTRIRMAIAGAVVSGSMLAGGVAGATLFGATTLTAAAAASTTPAAAAAPAAGGFVPNEDPTHEAGESAAREAAENAGTAGPTTPAN